MQSVGEVMAIGRTFKESIQKAFRSLEVGIDGLEPKWDFEEDPQLKRARFFDLTSLRFATSFRLLKIREAFLNGKTVEEIFYITKIDSWFLHQIKMISDEDYESPIKRLKENGFSDAQIARNTNTSINKIRTSRIKNKITPSYKLVDTCSAEFKAKTPYCYSTYDYENEIEHSLNPSF